MAFEGNPGTNKLASVLAGRMRQEADSPLVLDFGEIHADGSLVTNTFPAAVPRGDYSLLKHLAPGETGDDFSDTGMEEKAGVPEEGGNDEAAGGAAGSAAPHEHKVLLPESMRSVRAGDRVLVAWVQNEAVVVGIVTGS